MLYRLQAKCEAVFNRNNDMPAWKNNLGAKGEADNNYTLNSFFMHKTTG